MTSYFAPVRAESAEPLALDLQSLFLAGRILPFGAKLSVTHVFRSSEKSPVEVVYCFPLPRDASLVSFQISGEGFSIASRLEPHGDAQKRYEEAIENGSLAAVTQQNLDGLVNLTVGNLRPGETVVVRLELIAGVSLSDTGLRLRFPFTVAPCYHSKMRVSLDGPGIGTIELPDDVAGGAFTPPFHADATELHKIGFDLQIEPASGVREIASPSHAVRMLLDAGDKVGVKLSPDRDIPNRDLVLDVKRDFGVGQAWTDGPCNGRKHFAAVVPSFVFGPPARTTRRVVFLLDRSGSMEGAPMKQARAAIENCLVKLSAGDQFGIVAFDSDSELFAKAMLEATRDNVEKACAFLSAIDARCGTELVSGVETATGLLNGSAGEIFLITDGQVSGTNEILAQARKCAVRLFCLGIGSASQDRFLELLARQTGGVCRFVTPSERMDDASLELFAALGGTVVAEVRIAKANVQPPSAGPVFSDTPFVAFGDTDAQAVDIELAWPQASRRVPLEAVAKDEGDGLIEKLQGARRIAELEACNDGSSESRRRILELSKRYGLASSEMSLVAVVERADDRRGEIPKTTIVPAGMPQNTQFESYFDLPLPSRRKSNALRSFKENIIMGRIRASRGPTFEVLESRDYAAPADTRMASRPETSKDLAAVVREAMRVVEDRESICELKDVNRFVDRLFMMLVSLQICAANVVQYELLTKFIDFLYGDVMDFFDTGQLINLDKWAVLRQQLEAAWPGLTSAAVSDVSAQSPTFDPSMEISNLDLFARE